MEQNLPAVSGPVEPTVRPVAWAMRIPGCDGSADWVELGEDHPEPNAPAVASPLYDKNGLDRAVAAERARCAELCEQVAAEVAPRERWTPDGASWEAECIGVFDGATDCAKRIRGPNVANNRRRRRSG